MALSLARRQVVPRSVTNPEHFPVDDLIKTVPQLKDVADLTGEQVANIRSQTMNHDVRLKLAKRVNEELSPQKARILLMLALMNTNDPVKLQQVFMQY